MAERTHKPEPVQYLYRDHFITRCDVAGNQWDDAFPWMVTDDGYMVCQGESVDDCMAAIDAVVDGE